MNILLIKFIGDFRMEFLERLGTVLGKLAAKNQEINNYKADYRGMNKEDLWKEYCELKSRSGETYKNRCQAVKIVLKESLEIEYEQMSNERLVSIYRKLENRTGQPNQMKCDAIKSVLRKRNYSLE